MSKGNREPKNIKRRLFYLFCFALVISVPSASVLYRVAFPEPVTYRISTGSELGIYHSLGKKICSSSHNKGIHLETQTSRGSIDNTTRLETEQCDFAIIQNDTPSNPSIRSLAVVYEEMLHLIVRSDSEIKCLNDLAGKRVSVGSTSGGTHAVTKALLDFVISDDLQEPQMNFLDSQASIKALKEKSIDAAFLVTGLRSPAMLEALSDDSLILISLAPNRDSNEQDIQDLIQGFRTVYPYMQFATLPMRTYGNCPPAPIATLSISAVLVCGKSTSINAAQSVTELLFENKAVFAKAIPLLAGLDEINARQNLQFPLHTGADYHYRRREPTFLHENAEAMGFLLTIFLLFGSSLKGIASWRKRTSKEHIDTYFLRIAEIETSLMQKDSPVTTQELSEELQRMEIQAYQDLIEERLSANNSYLIFLSMITRANEKIRARSDQSSMDY